jgi:hypothetical protein
MAGMGLAGTALAGTFGTRIQIGGEGADLALDEPRGLLYVADFTRTRIEVVSLAANQVVNSIGVDPNPSSLSISPNGRWLLVTHFGNDSLPAPPNNVVTLIDLANQYAIKKYSLNDPPLGVAFGKDNLALVVTTTQFFLFDPLQGFVGVLGTIADIKAKALPAPADSFPADITTASVAASADGPWNGRLERHFHFHLRCIVAHHSRRWSGSGARPRGELKGNGSRYGGLVTDSGAYDKVPPA